MSIGLKYSYPRLNQKLRKTNCTHGDGDVITVKNMKKLKWIKRNANTKIPKVKKRTIGLIEANRG